MIDRKLAGLAAPIGAALGRMRAEIRAETQKMIDQVKTEVRAALAADEAGLGAALDERLEKPDSLLARWQASDELTSLARSGAAARPN